MLTIRTFPVNMIEENTYVVSDNATRQAAIIDCGALHAEERTAIAAYITEQQLHVAHLLNTHGHFDHVFGLQWAADTYHTLPKLHAEEEALYLAAEAGMEMLMRRKVSLPVPPVGTRLHDGDTITLGHHTFRVIFTPGHTPGGVCFYDAEAQVLFSGDSLFRAEIGRCDLPGGNFEALTDALRTRILTLPDETTVYPGHGPTTTIAYERVHNPYL